MNQNSNVQISSITYYLARTLQRGLELTGWGLNMYMCNDAKSDGAMTEQLHATSCYQHNIPHLHFYTRKTAFLRRRVYTNYSRDSIDTTR